MQPICALIKRFRLPSCHDFIPSIERMNIIRLSSDGIQLVICTFLEILANLLFRKCCSACHVRFSWKLIILSLTNQDRLENLYDRKEVGSAMKKNSIRVCKFHCEDIAHEFLNMSYFSRTIIPLGDN